MQVLFRVAATELVNLTRRIQDFLLAGIERVARRANFNAEFVFSVCRTGIKTIAAAAFDSNVLVFGMNSRLHQ